MFAGARGARTSRSRRPLAAPSEPQQPPEPRLQTDAAAATCDELRAAEERDCSTATAGSTGDAGVVRIPIDAAMRHRGRARPAARAAPRRRRRAPLPRDERAADVAARRALLAALRLARRARAAPRRRAQRRPAAILRDVGFDQHLGEQVPLDLAFRDETGARGARSATTSASKPVILSLVYYECPMLCTLVLNGAGRAR